MPNQACKSTETEGEDLSFMNLEGAAINEDPVAGNGSFKV